VRPVLGNGKALRYGVGVGPRRLYWDIHDGQGEEDRGDEVAERYHHPAKTSHTILPIIFSGPVPTSSRPKYWSRGTAL
jgi:hypothetical protein